MALLLACHNLCTNGDPQSTCPPSDINVVMSSPVLGMAVLAAASAWLVGSWFIHRDR